MIFATVLGQPALFAVNEDVLPAGLSLRESRLLVGALNFHALMAPGRELRIHLYADAVGLPRTTDDATFTGMSRDFRKRRATFDIVSMVPREAYPPVAAGTVAQPLIARFDRHVKITLDEVLDKVPRVDDSRRIFHRVLRRAKAVAPLAYDQLRDIELLRHRPTVTRRAPRRDYDRELESIGAPAPIELEPGAPRAAIFGLHWFELGGAERWAFESIRIARDAGLIPIVLSNRDSQQPWIGRPELDGAIIIPFSEPTVQSQTPGVEGLLRACLRMFDVRGVSVHHNQWLYDRLPWIERQLPSASIVDSTHIVEFRGGGYPRSSAIVEKFISRHHVISPSLGRWMTDVQGIPEEKVVVAPLGGLTVELKDVSFRRRPPNAPFTVAFVGRMARQKGPEVFLEIARRLRDSGNEYRFIMHGDGELSSWLDELTRRAGMTNTILRRDATVPVTETLDASDLLVVTSHNEGLTLTTLEAIAHGIPVVSTNVGAQSDIIPPRALVPRNAYLAARDGARLVASLAADEAAREALWQDERAAEQALLERRSASDWFMKEVRTW